MANPFSAMNLIGAGFSSDPSQLESAIPNVGLSNSGDLGSSSDIFSLPDGSGQSGPVAPAFGSDSMNNDGGATGSWQPSSTDQSALSAINTTAGIFGSTANGGGSGGGSTASTSDSVFSISNWTHLFTRVLVMVLGLIFVGVGLALFSGGKILQEVESPETGSPSGSEKPHTAARIAGEMI